MLLLILESLGSTELLFILVMALVFFGPRKLPQLSRSLGRGLAEFRRASEDFKRTWEREVNFEETSAPNTGNQNTPGANSILAGDIENQDLQLPTIEPVTPDRVIARESMSHVSPDPSEPGSPTGLEADSPSHSSRKSDWL